MNILYYDYKNPGAILQSINGNVYSLSDGVIIHIGKTQEGRLVVTVQYDPQHALRYFFDITNLIEGDMVARGDILGTLFRDDYRIEYTTPNRNSSNIPVRFGRYLFWKQNPEPVLTGSIPLPSPNDEWFNNITPFVDHYVDGPIGEWLAQQ